MTMPYAKFPPLPPGLERDQTHHGRWYFTLAQMREYGQKCAEDAIREIDKSRAKHNACGQKPDDTVDFLRGMMGMK